MIHVLLVLKTVESPRDVLVGDFHVFNRFSNIVSRLPSECLTIDSVHGLDHALVVPKEGLMVQVLDVFLSVMVDAVHIVCVGLVVAVLVAGFGHGGVHVTLHAEALRELLCELLGLSLLQDSVGVLEEILIFLPVLFFHDVLG